jgi:hypothetical protein
MDIIIVVIFLMLFLFIMVVAVGVVLYVWMKPFMPYIRAKLDKKDILFLIGKDNKVRLVPAKYSSGVYNTATPPYSFLHKVPRAYRFGDLQCVFVHDGWGVTLDPDYAEVIQELKAKGVTDYEELDRRLSGKDDKGKPIPDDEKLNHSDIIRIHAFKDIDFGDFLSFSADMTPTELRSHIDEFIAKFTEDQRKLDPSKSGGGGNMNMIIIIIILAVIGYFGMKSFGIGF